MNTAHISQRIEDAISVKQLLIEDERLLKEVEAVIKAFVKCYRSDGKVLFCGNGGSAADAQHLAGELSARFYLDRPPLNAEALHVNTSYLTATANDYEWEDTFSRAVAAKGKQGDILCCLSTSGNSENVVNAASAGKEMGLSVVGFTGQKPSSLDSFCDLLIKIPSTNTPRIQEAHILIGHIICEFVEATLFCR